MKTPPRSFLLTALTLALPLCDHAHALISGINTPGTSLASINFDDTNSFSPPPGTTNITPSVTPWNGALFSLPFTTDTTTLDTAQGDIMASFAGNSYALTFTNVLLQQSLLNTGFAKLVFQFNVEYQLDAAGLPSQATLYPIFNVTGTVQTGGFAGVSGSIDYIGLDASANYSILETVNDNQFFVPPPNTFSGNVLGVPVFGGPLNGFTGLPSGTTLTLNGNFTFKVDPASINATSAPEPSASLLTLLSLPLLLARRRAQRA